MHPHAIAAMVHGMCMATALLKECVEVCELSAYVSDLAPDGKSWNTLIAAGNMHCQNWESKSFLQNAL